MFLLFNQMHWSSQINYMCDLFTSRALRTNLSSALPTFIPGVPNNLAFTNQTHTNSRTLSTLDSCPGVKSFSHWCPLTVNIVLERTTSRISTECTRAVTHMFCITTSVILNRKVGLFLSEHWRISAAESNDAQVAQHLYVSLDLDETFRYQSS